MDDKKAYEDGLRDGRIEALSRMGKNLAAEVREHANRLRVLERIMWGAIGAYTLLQVLPNLITAGERLAQ